MNFNSRELKNLLNVYKLTDFANNQLYGTTGYRMNANDLDGIVFRVSILAMMRSLNLGKTVGLMITASHNPEQDNGVKIVEPNGDMLARDWENLAMELVSWSYEEFDENLHTKCKQLNIDLDKSNEASVLIGYDTRSSSPHLAKIIQTGLNLFESQYMMFQLVTTPQLHFFVKTYNCNSELRSKAALMDHYFTRFSTAFLTGEVRDAELHVDCANGVGAREISRMASLVQPQLNLVLHNTGFIGALNHQCGADFVKIGQCCPILHGEDGKPEPGQRWCSLDGDADRIVYFYLEKDGSSTFKLLDGDRMAVLIAEYVAPLLAALPIGTNDRKASLGLVQTAYANGASTQYIQQRLAIEPVCVPTGVKHLHAAARAFDVGIYFEANGHGTVIFSEWMRSLLASSSGSQAAIELARLVQLVNEADGDAICDLLLVEYVLAARNLELAAWGGLYTDRPSRQLKVDVPDRNAIITGDAERRVIKPALLQERVDALVMQYGGEDNTRSFVRPSGTEDVVRVYAEAKTQQQADSLAEAVASQVRAVLQS